MMPDLRPEKAFIFRIIHRDNLDWILHHGLQSRSSQLVNPNYVDIGNPELIHKRNNRPIACAPGGTLSDYIPFYFTPRSPMLMNIKTGCGVRARKNEKILILVSSLFKVQKSKLEFLFTDRHAYLQTAEFHSDLARLDKIDWAILQRSDFKRDNDDLGKFERYQAEALIFQHLPIGALLGVACVNEGVAAEVRDQIEAAGIEFKVVAKPRWYFS